MREYLGLQGVSMEQFAASEAGRDFVRRHTFIGEDVVSRDYVNLNGRSRSFICLTDSDTRNYRCTVDGHPLHFGFPPINVTGGELVTFDGVLAD
ncbi:hypothetical protein [Deinococcus budaensis]|uniref:Uncharacterized protein n=1 Tax=Deinococcus budaensis TaxID=1665626 RepID=A0A7W8GE88_9DEIO|nr:hypothetical protein [Deinococcus budaensis]MBB5233950.1 hypothetical protein [Deinococcus budaensis]